MVTQSANDLNLTLVVDAEHADRLVQKLHELLISPRAGSQPEFGDSWVALTHPAPVPPVPAWWEVAAEPLMQQLGEHPAAFVYDMATVRRAAESLRSMQSVDRVLYAVKANDHPQILQTLQAAGIGFDCVSADEIRHLTTAVPAVTVEDILFTPNFAGRGEYAEALDLGVCVTIDNIHPLMQWTDLFKGREIFLRVDLNLGHGHHRKVITSGSQSKFGISMAQLETLPPFLAKHGIRVTGLHAHTGSGVHDAAVWQEQLQRMQAVMPLFPSVRVLDLGGGLGVPETPGQPALDLERLDELLGAAAAATEAAVWLEPGRFLVAQSGVLLARVTQVKSKDDYHYLGLATGMNSLIRPALYGAYHEIVNLTRLGQPARHRYNVVGPICESGDVLGESRFLPASEEGDIILIANTGAYGRVMSSHYNRRAPAVELILDRPDGI
jgi:diaminopimelate decarboxylase/aspartate kinase